MKTLIAAFLIALLAIVCVYYALSLLGVAETIASSMASTILGGVPYIRESLDKLLAAREHSQEIPVLSLGRFGLSSQRLILYGSLMVFGAMQFASAVGGFLSGILNVEPEKQNVLILVFVFLLVFPAAFLVGRWVGRRSVANGLLTIFLIGLIARTATTLGDIFLVAPKELESFLSDLGAGSIPLLVIKQLVAGIVLFFVLGALGYWRGRGQRLGSYLGYLLKKVPDATQHAIVELAFKEVGRVPGFNTTVQPSSFVVERDGPQTAPRFGETLAQGSEPAHPRDTEKSSKPRRYTQVGEQFPFPGPGQAATILVGVEGSMQDRQFLVETEIFHIGRNSSNDLVIPNDNYVSGNHASLQYEKGSLLIVDLSSRNGTFVNEIRVLNTPQVLQPGDRIRVGNTTFKVVPAS